MKVEWFKKNIITKCYICYALKCYICYAENEKNPICILWSSVQPFSGIGIWVPNHFVLIKTLGYCIDITTNSTRQHFILDISDSIEFPPLSSETVEPTDERFTYNDSRTTHRKWLLTTISPIVSTECTLDIMSKHKRMMMQFITFISPPFSNPTENSLPGKSMDFDKTFKTLTETRHGDNLPLIPDGRKENVYFLVDNDHRSKTTKKQYNVIF